MDVKQNDTQRCLGELEAALLEYIVKYGLTEKAKLAISRVATRRATFGDDLTK